MGEVVEEGGMVCLMKNPDAECIGTVNLGKARVVLGTRDDYFMIREIHYDADHFTKEDVEEIDRRTGDCALCRGFRKEDLGDAVEAAPDFSFF